MPAYLVKKRVSVEAFQVKSEGDEANWPEWAKAARLKPDDEIGAILLRPILPGYCIETLAGRSVVEIGDWIVRNEDGVIARCKKDDFDGLYELEA